MRNRAEQIRYCLKGRRDKERCCVLVDRLQFLATWRKKQIPAIPGFAVRSDTLVRPQTSIVTYRRVRSCENARTGTKLFIQYRPACPWLAPIKATLIANDRVGLQRREVESVVETFKRVRMLLVEVALDFQEAD